MGIERASTARWDVSLRSRDVEEACAYLDANGFRLALDSRRASHLDMCTRGVRLPGLYLAYIQYGAPVTVRADPGRDDYWILLPIRGGLEASSGSHSVCGSPRRAVTFSYPSIGSSQIRAEENSARLMVKLMPGAVIRELTALLGAPPDAPLELAPEISLTEGYGKSLAGYLRLAIADFTRADSLLRNPIAVSSFEHFILSGLLMAHRHNYSEALRRLDRPINPRGLKRAIEYMEAHLDQAVTLADVVRASGVPGRTLFKHFKEYRGVSPMNYLRTVRFQKVRDDLRRSEPDGCVMDIAMHWGFEHMGRFAVEYRRRFGESPSHTLGKCLRSSIS
jgi:AraC-like DNA-binding protein